MIHKKSILMVIFPFLFSFFYFFERSVSSNSFHILCLTGVLLVLFSKQNIFKVKNNELSWLHIVLFSLILILMSFLFYYLSDSKLSYIDTPFSIVLSIVPFAIFFRALDTEEVIIYLSIIVFILSAILSHWLGHQEEYGSRVIESRYFKLLYFAPLVIAFKWMNISSRIFIIITSLGILGALVTVIITYCCYELANGDLIDKFGFSESVSGNTNPIFFGLISLALTVSMIIFVFFDKQEVKKVAALSIISILGIICIIASESRGVWLSFLVIIIFILIIFSINVNFSKTKKVFITLFSVLIVFSAFSSQIVKDRVSLAMSEIEEYKERSSFDDIKRTSSFGTRIELWKASVKMFKNNYLFGVGPGGYRTELIMLNKNGEFKKEFTKYNQAHGQYFHVLATRGVIGFLAVMFLLVTFLMFLLRKALCNSYQIRYMAGCGIVVILSYIILGVTESPFERRSTIVFFVFYLSLIVATIKNHKLQ